MFLIYSSKLIFVVRDSYPVTKHHTLIIPHRHVSDFFNLSDNELLDLNQILTSAHNRDVLSTKLKKTVFHFPPNT